MAPELKGITGYINTEDQITLLALKGALFYWSFGPIPESIVLGRCPI